MQITVLVSPLGSLGDVPCNLVAYINGSSSQALKALISVHCFSLIASISMLEYTALAIITILKDANSFKQTNDAFSSYIDVELISANLHLDNELECSFIFTKVSTTFAMLEGNAGILQQQIICSKLLVLKRCHYPNSSKS